jgi:hypothetical protein
MMKRLLLLGALALAMTASAADGQRSSRRGSEGQIELGIDGGITFGLDNPHFTLVSLPVQVFRVGYFLNDRFEIEPRLSLNSVSGGGATVSVYTLGLGLLYQPNGDRIGKGLYFRPFAALNGVSASGPGGDNSGEVGIGVGVKLPFDDRRLATRLEANYAHSDGANLIGLLFGLSWFTR